MAAAVALTRSVKRFFTAADVLAMASSIIPESSASTVVTTLAEKVETMIDNAAKGITGDNNYVRIALVLFLSLWIMFGLMEIVQRVMRWRQQGTPVTAALPGGEAVVSEASKKRI